MQTTTGKEGLAGETNQPKSEGTQYFLTKVIVSLKQASSEILSSARDGR